MRNRILIAALLTGAALSPRPAEACASGLISIVDPFLLPNGQPWSGSVVYTLGYNSTSAGATFVGARQQFNVTSGINTCLVPGLYTPVSLQQGGISYAVTTQWTVPASGGPYTIAQLSGAVQLVPQLLFSNTVTWSNAQVLALSTVAQQLVPALGAGVVIVPVRIMYEAANDVYVQSGTLNIAAGNFGSNVVVGAFGPFNDSGLADYLFSYFFPGTIVGDSSLNVNQPLIAYASIPVTGMGGNVYVTTWYYTYTVRA